MHRCDAGVAMLHVRRGILLPISLCSPSSCTPFTRVCVCSSRPRSPGPLETLPRLGHVLLLEELCVLGAQLELAVPDRLVDALLAAQPDDGLHTLLDRPCRGDARHAHVVLLRDLLYARDDLLVDGVFAAVDELLEELVRRGAGRGAFGPGAGEGAAGDGGPGDEADARVLTVGDLRMALDGRGKRGGGWGVPSRALLRGRSGCSSSASR